MSTSVTVFHVRERAAEDVERALDAIFAREERPRALRLEGTYSAVLARVTDPALDASYRYLLLRPHAPSKWTPMFELGNRTVGLEVEISKALDGADVVSTFVYDDGLSGYVVAREGREVDRYVSDPTYFGESEEQGGEPEAQPNAGAEGEDALSGHPQWFADLLPSGTSPEDFARVVLRPGYWEEREGGATDKEDDEEELVDELDRMRCIGLALELWEPEEYPLAQPPEEIPNAVAGPAIVVAYV